MAKKLKAISEALRAAKSLQSSRRYAKKNKGLTAARRKEFEKIGAPKSLIDMLDKQARHVDPLSIKSLKKRMADIREGEKIARQYPDPKLDKEIEALEQFIKKRSKVLKRKKIEDAVTGATLGAGLTESMRQMHKKSRRKAKGGMVSKRSKPRGVGAAKRGFGRAAR